MSHPLPPELARCYAEPFGPCERELAQAAEKARSEWCTEGVIDTRKVRVVYATSDLHGDAGWFLHWLVCAGLVRVSAAGYDWVSPKAALVVCGDVADDKRGAAHDDALLERRGFDGFGGVRRGSGTWNALAFISFLVARRGAKIVVVLGNHELMNVLGDPGAAGYKRAVTAEEESRRGGWGPSGGMRALLGEPLVAVCAGKFLFMHAEPPLFGPNVMFGKPRAPLAEFTVGLNRAARADLADPLVRMAVWGRSLGGSVSPVTCSTFRAFFPDATLVRGHCPNRPRTPGEAGGRVFGAKSEVAPAVLARLSGCLADARVYTARAPAELSTESGYHGVVVSCGADRDGSFGGSVFRIDCMGSLAFGHEERESSVVAFDARRGTAFCLVSVRKDGVPRGAVR